MKTAAKRTRGQSLVEFALVIPMLLLLMVGIMEFSRAWMAKNILTGAAREAARIAVVPPPGGSVEEGYTRGYAVLSSAGLSGATIDIDPGSGAYGTVIATASYSFPVSVVGFIPGLAGATIPLSSTTTMRREY